VCLAAAALGIAGLRYCAPMQAILAVTVPFFALVLLGYLAAQREVLPESAIPGLNAYVLFFALPWMLFPVRLEPAVRAPIRSPSVTSPP